MKRYTASFDYTGHAPTSSFMRDLINEAGYTNIKEISTVIWEIKTTQTQQTVETGLEIAIKNHGKYQGGEVTSVEVSAAQETAAGQN